MYIVIVGNVVVFDPGQGRVHSTGSCNDCNKLPLELNYRSLFLTYKINYGSLFYHYKKTTVIAKKLW